MKKGSKKINGKTKKITIRLTEEEFRYIQNKTKIESISISEYIRNLIKK